MKTFTSKLLSALPALAGVRAVPSEQNHATAVENTTPVKLLGRGEACGYSASSKGSSICGESLCCNLEDNVCGSGPRACSPLSCLPKYSTGCAMQGDINRDLQTHSSSSEQGLPSSFQKRQGTGAEDAHDSSPSLGQLYTRPDLSWLSRMPRPQLGSIPYGQLMTSCNEPGTVALTFDDGPWEYTEELLDILSGYEAKATFFVCGGNMGGDGQIIKSGRHHLLRRMVSEGHQVGTHTYAHPDLGSVDDQVVLGQLLLNEQAIAQALDRIPTYFRPPYFSYNDGVLDTTARLGYHVVNAGVDTNDWKGDYDAARQSFSQALQQGASAPGMIVLAHDIHERTVRELTAYMIEQARGAGFRLVTVGECMGDPEGNWYRDPRTGGSLSGGQTSYAPDGSQLTKRDEAPEGHPQKVPLEYDPMRPLLRSSSTTAQKLTTIAARAGGAGGTATLGEAAEPAVEHATPDVSEERMVAGGPGAWHSNTVGSSSPKATFGFVLVLVNMFFLLQ